VPSRILAALAALTFVALAANADEKKEPPKEMKLIAKFSGSVNDDKAEAPKEPVITNEKDLKKLWDDWKLTDKMPKVDFDKELVLVSTTKGSRLNVNIKVSEEGDLTLVAVSTRDLRPGLRYLIQVIERGGIKTVNGKKLEAK
jgi:hypothetical protein